MLSVRYYISRLGAKQRARQTAGHSKQPCDDITRGIRGRRAPEARLDLPEQAMAGLFAVLSG